jgi:hypothetical protein
VRVLHPVAAQERFIARGEYRYQRDGDNLRLSERWTLHQVAGGAFLYRVDEDGRDEDGLTILSEALVSPEGKLERFNVQSFNPRDPELVPFKADYVFYDAYVQIGSRRASGEHEYDEFALVADVVPYLRQTVLMGLTISGVHAQGGSAPIFNPALLSTEGSRIQKMQVIEREQSDLTVGNATIPAVCYQIAGDIFYWLDPHTIPLRREYTYAGQKYVASLMNYAYSRT